MIEADNMTIMAYQCCIRGTQEVLERPKLDTVSLLQFYNLMERIEKEYTGLPENNIKEEARSRLERIGLLEKPN